MSDDFYDEAARKRYQVLEAAKQRCIANLEEYKATGDDYSAQEELQTLATLRDQQDSLSRLHQQYHQSRNPVRQQMTDQEFLAMSPERLAQSPEAVEAIFAKSKYYNVQDAQDPEFQRRFYAGIEEVKRRRREESGRR